MAEKKLMVRKHVVAQAEDSERKGVSNLIVGSRLNAVQLWGGILASALLLIQHTKQVQDKGLQDYVFWFVVLMNITNNIATAVQQAFNLFEVSKIHEEAFADIRATFWSFATLSGRFHGKTHEEAFAEFSDKVVRVKHRESEEVRSARSKGKQKADHTDGSTTGSQALTARPRLMNASMHLQAQESFRVMQPQRQ